MDLHMCIYTAKNLFCPFIITHEKAFAHLILTVTSIVSFALFHKSVVKSNPFRF